MENKKFIFFIIKFLMIVVFLIVVQIPKSYAAARTNIQKATVVLSSYSYVYDGQAKKPAIRYVKVGRKYLNSSDYSFRYVDNVNAGQAGVIITGKGNYTGTKGIYFSIKRRDISAYNKKLFNDQTYNGQTKKPGCTIRIDNRTLASGKDYDITYSNNTNAGTATVTITGKGNYQGKFKQNFTINKKDISKYNTKNLFSDQVYDGKAQTPLCTIRIDNRSLGRDKDYDIYYRNNVNVGTATATIIGKGNYTGKFDVTFKINPINISNWNQTWNLSCGKYTYTGQECRPVLEAKAPNGKYLKNGEDYTISYSDNINVGEGMATVIGKGNYKGKFNLAFEIVQKDISSYQGQLSNTQYIYDGQKKEPNITIKIYNRQLTKDRDYKISYINNTNVGTANVKITGINNYKGSFTQDFYIVKKDISKFNAELKSTSYEYNGKEIKPTATVKGNNKTLQAGKDYTIKYSNNNKVGTATASIQGVGNYAGQIAKTFIIKKKVTKAETIISKAKEIKKYMAENKYEYCVIGSCRIPKDNPEHNSHISNSKCGLSATFADSQKHNTNVQLGIDGYHNVCCATYVSWVLREAGIINFTDHNAKNLSDRLLATGKFEEVTEGITKGKFLEFKTKSLKPGDIIAYDGVGHIEIAADANYVYSAGSRWDEIWVKGATHRRDNSKPNDYNRIIYRVLRIKE